MGFGEFIRLFKLRAREILRGGVEVYGSCRQCGQCCRSIYLVNDGRPVKSERVFRRMVRQAPEFDRLYVCGRSPEGLLRFSCSWLTEEGGCRDHENSLPLCKMFPSRSMYGLGAALPEGCGYRFVQSRRFRKELNRALKSQKT